MARKPLLGGGLKIDLEKLCVESGEECDAARGSLHVGELLVSANGLSAKGQSYGLRVEDISFADATLLGRGSSGAVRRVRSVSSGSYVALKEIRATSHAHVQEIKRELETLYDGKTAPPPYLVELQGAFSFEGSFFIAMECMDGSLDSLSAAPIPAEPLARITRSILCGLNYLHKQRHLIHRDLKPSNLLFNWDGTVKIADFGVSSALECTKGNAQSFVGTVTYMSPERLKGEVYSYAADIWSLGLVVVELALGHGPYNHVLEMSENPHRFSSGEARFWILLQHLNSDAPVLCLPSWCDAKVRDFVSLCIRRDHAQRPSCEELLRHPFIFDLATGSESDNQRALCTWLNAGPRLSHGTISGSGVEDDVREVHGAHGHCVIEGPSGRTRDGSNLAGATVPHRSSTHPPTTSGSVAPPPSDVAAVDELPPANVVAVSHRRHSSPELSLDLDEELRSLVKDHLV